jgi:predicted alpha/beta-fold hydrolase
MPLVEYSTYTPPIFFKDCHLQTIYPVLFRKVTGVKYTRERIDTPDGDFLDLDWSRVGSDKAVIAIHGLEGSSRSKYMPGILKAFNRRGWDGVGLNLRGCSGEINKQLRFYHAGATEDVHTVVGYLLAQNRYTEISLVGFSIGGNLTLKYLGEQGASLSPLIKRAAAISVPCDLASCAWKLAEKSNVIYMKRFLFSFHRKIKAKMQVMPDKINDENFHEIKTFKEYDDCYTAPLHGFANAEDYWAKSSSNPYLSNIRIPTLIINAIDDPFLTKESYPIEEAQQNHCLFLEIPNSGGHVGFITFNHDHEYWHETRVTSFIIDC